MIYCKTEVPDVEVVDEDTVAGSFFELRIGDERVRIRGIGEPGIGQPVLLDGSGDATLLVRWLAANRTNRIGPGNFCVRRSTGRTEYRFKAMTSAASCLSGSCTLMTRVGRLDGLDEDEAECEGDDHPELG